MKLQIIKTKEEAKEQIKKLYGIDAKQLWLWMLLHSKYKEFVPVWRFGFGATDLIPAFEEHFFLFAEGINLEQGRIIKNGDCFLVGGSYYKKQENGFEELDKILTQDDAATLFSFFSEEKDREVIPIKIKGASGKYYPLWGVDNEPYTYVRPLSFDVVSKDIAPNSLTEYAFLGEEFELDDKTTVRLSYNDKSLNGFVFEIV